MRIGVYLTAWAMAAGGFTFLQAAASAAPADPKSLASSPPWFQLLDRLVGPQAASGIAAVAIGPVSLVLLWALLQTNGRARHGFGGPVHWVYRWIAFVLLCLFGLVVVLGIAVRRASEWQDAAVFGGWAAFLVGCAVVIYGLGLVRNQQPGVSRPSWPLATRAWRSTARIVHPKST
jgi:hypothetical protein